MHHGDDGGVDSDGDGDDGDDSYGDDGDGDSNGGMIVPIVMVSVMVMNSTSKCAAVGNCCRADGMG